ncbi:MAG: SGNH/GDSL hydrolase family protein [Betaproteobacteria bacterium]|nr:SGNH/GDSL hydrolase family protein [Betaproteobacteria bacterium]
MAVYWDEGLMQDEGRSPDVLAEGDSWFSYWIPGNGNLMDRFDRDVWKDRYTILCLAYPGDEAIKMVDGHSRWVLQETLRGYSTIRVLLFSGGGNDIAADNLLKLLRPDCSGATDYRACFRDGQPGRRLAEIEHAYRDLVAIRDLYRPEAVIVTHNYDYAVLGKRLLWMAWLDPYLRLAKVPKALREDVVAEFIDGFADMLAGLRGPGFEFVKTSGTLKNGDWANELHPNANGFRKIAGKFRKTLLRRLP